MILLTSIYEDVGVLHILQGAESDLFMRGDYALFLEDVQKRLEKSGAKKLMLRITRVFHEKIVAEALKPMLDHVVRDENNVFRFPTKESYYDMFGSMGVIELQHDPSGHRPNAGKKRTLDIEIGVCSFCNNPEAKLLKGIKPTVCISCKKINDAMGRNSAKGNSHG